MATKIFKGWLSEQLQDLGDDVFGSYIIGILEGDESIDEKKEAISDIISGIITEATECDELVANILKKWNDSQTNETQTETQTQEPKMDVNEQLAKMLESQRLQNTIKSREYTEEERRIKEQILAQYSQSAISDEEDGDVVDEVPEKQTTGNSLGGIEKNTNVQDVMQLQKERREQARMDSAAKKQKDKEDREKQKKLREEKKEKRKTVKGERRR